MIRFVLLFLVLMAIIGLFGKWTRGGGARGLQGRKRDRAIESARKCPECGTYLVGDVPCDCGSERRE